MTGCSGYLLRGLAISPDETFDFIDTRVLVVMDPAVGRCRHRLSTWRDSYIIVIMMIMIIWQMEKGDILDGVVVENGPDILRKVINVRPDEIVRNRYNIAVSIDRFDNFL